MRGSGRRLLTDAGTFGYMCRNIVRLREGSEIGGLDDMEAAARQYVRKVSGFTEPAAHNTDVFERAVAEIAEATERLMRGLVVRSG